MTPGTVIHFPNFVFHDGAIRDKYLIALGSALGITVLQNCCQFPKPTWVCLDDYYEFDDQELARRGQAGDFQIAHILPPGIAVELAQCAIDSDDISGEQASIVRAANGL